MSRTKKQVEKVMENEVDFETYLQNNYTEPKDELPKVSIYQQLNDFQNEVPALVKDTKGYGYNYADLNQVIKVITPLLRKHGLGIIQPLTGSGIKTILYSTITGETIESFCEIPQGVELKGMNYYQSYGSAVSYFRRYSVVSFLNLIADQDTNAQGEQVKKNAFPVKEKKLLSNGEFERAIHAIENNEYTKDQLLRNYSLNNDQLTKINGL